MKMYSKISILLLLFVFVIGIKETNAQRRTKSDTTSKEYKEQEEKFTNKLWYGGGFNLAFNSSNFGSQMQIGVSPLVGYKITERFSIGPRVGIDYIEYFQDGLNPRFILWSVGPFARAKITPSIFAHTEYQVTGVSGLNDASNIISPRNENFYLGLGYQSSAGGTVGYEMVALFNFLEDNERSLPIEFRVGLNWNF